MAALAARAAPLLLTVAVLGACLAGLGCGNAESRVQGVELVELPDGGADTAGWSPDSRRIAISARHGLVLLSPGRDDREAIAGPRLSGYLGAASRIGWSRDGRRLRYLTDRGPSNGIGAWATEVRRDGGGLRQSPLGVAVFSAAWAPSGWPLVYAIGPYGPSHHGSVEGPRSALMTLAKVGAQPRRLLRPSGRPDKPSFAPNGERILYRQWLKGHTELRTVSATGSRPRRLARFALIPHVEWSPDGRRIALAAVPRFGPGHTWIFLMPANGGEPRQVGDEDVLDGPIWSPDGRWLTFSTPEGEIRRIHPDGSGAETIADLGGEEVRGLLWSPNGHFLAYSARPFATSD